LDAFRAHAGHGEEVFAVGGAQAFQGHSFDGERDGGRGREATLAPDHVGEGPGFRRGGSSFPGPGNRSAEGIFENLEGTRADLGNGEEPFLSHSGEVGQRAIAGLS